MGLSLPALTRFAFTSKFPSQLLPNSRSILTVLDRAFYGMRNRVSAVFRVSYGTKRDSFDQISTMTRDQDEEILRLRELLEEKDIELEVICVIK